MTGHGVRLGDDGRLVVVRSSPPEDRERLLRTIESVRESAGAGAVEILEVRDDGSFVELVLAFAGRSPSPPVAAASLLPLAAALSGHLSDLHLRRLAHGAVRADHVLVDAAGTVRLCGFGSATGAAPSDDVHALGVLIDGLLDADERGATADALRLQAERCRTADVDARPTMAAIAASLASVATPGRTVTLTSTASARRRWPIAVIALVVVIVALLVAVRPRAAHEPTRPAAAAANARPIATTSTTTSTTVRPARVWPTTLQGAGSSWTFGDADDRRVLGDWDCDGIATPALLQRPSGAIYVIDRWPTHADELPARFVSTIFGAVDASVEHGDGCDALVVATRDGEVRPAVASGEARPRSPAGAPDA